MPNPTTAKPATAELLSSDPLFAAIKAKVPIVATSTGTLREVVGNKASRPTRGTGVATVTPLAYGPAPAINPTGFAPGGTPLGPSLAFGHGRQQIRFLGAGYATKPSVFSAFAVFRPVFPSGTIEGTWACWAVASSNDGGAGGLGFTVGGGVATLAALRAQGITSSALALTSGHWYAAWVTFDDSGGTKFVNFWLYDFTSQALLSAAGGVGTQVSAGATSAANASDSGLCVGATNFSASGNHPMPFLGEIADAGLYAGAGTDTLFGGYFADPWSLVRGSYTPSGALAAGDAWPHDATTTQLMVGATRCTGTGTGGTGAPTYQWYASQTSNFTPGAGNLLAGATGLNLAWTPPTPGAWWHKLVATDGSSAVTYQQVGIATYPKDDIKLLSIGDSIHWAVLVPVVLQPAGGAMAQALYASGRRTIVHHRAVTGASTLAASWGVGGPILASAVADAVADGITDAEIMLGANDAATLSAATFQSNLSGIIGYLASNGFRRIWLHYTTPEQQPAAANDAYNATLGSFQAAIDALVAANPGLCYAGDKYAYQTMMIEAGLFSGLHPIGEQANRLGLGWARAILATIDGGGAPAGFRRTTFNGGF